MGEHSITNHDRGQSQSSLVYPVLSRRSGGLSLGINLFPDRKYCSFDCPYCEVMPFESDRVFSPAELEIELEAFFTNDYSRDWVPLPLRDLCISGNGEPSLSPHLWDALELCAVARRRYAAIAGSAPILLITNATGFLDEEISRRLAAFATRVPLKIWAKLDAGSQELFKAMSRSSFRLDEITEALGKFARGTSIVIQTMVCDVGGRVPGEAEALDYASRINAMLEKGAIIENIDIYTLARRPSASWVRPMPDDSIRTFMNTVSCALTKPLSVSGYGEKGGSPLLPR
jgi:wyosine [tRNA(Phe)-imidazoG37] synthetase (radical SAM superfamily)